MIVPAQPSSLLDSLLSCITIEAVHFLSLLYVDFRYLYVHRKLVWSIWILLMPLVNCIVKSEAIREEGATIWYNDCRVFPTVRRTDTTSPAKAAQATCIHISSILQMFNHSIRKDIKQMLRHPFRRISVELLRDHETELQFFYRQSHYCQKRS